MTISTQCANSWCKQTFSEISGESALREKFGVGTLPENCPGCRHQLRAGFKAGISFYRRNSSLSGKNLISIYHSEQPFPVYAIEEWWGDGWDPFRYGDIWRNSRPFFEQIGHLLQNVPRMANYNNNCENSEYCSYAGQAKNCYFSDVCFRSQDVLYSDTITGYCDSIIDSLACSRSSHLFECILCRNTHSSGYLIRGIDCGGCYFSYDLKGCRNCIFCSNLRNKEFYAYNKPVSATEFERIRARALDGKQSTLLQSLDSWNEILSQAAHRHLEMTNCEDCQGDELNNCQNCIDCFFCLNTRGARHCVELAPGESSADYLDVTIAGIGELLFNSVILGGGNYFLRMCVNCRASSDLTYCVDCFSCRNCFGCVGLRNSQHCILNRQYSKDEYQILVRRIEAAMSETGEWGRFYPRELSPFAYNESVAQRLVPLSEDEAKRRRFAWHGRAESDASVGPVVELSDDISQFTAEQLNSPIACEVSGRQFRVIRKEWEMRQTYGTPLPREHPELRMTRRRQLLNPFLLRKTACMPCGKTVVTAYRADSNRKILCEKCYANALT